MELSDLEDHEMLESLDFQTPRGPKRKKLFFFGSWISRWIMSTPVPFGT